ncbi:MAG: hypothetical protein AAF962_11970 [Actinomycetota bacterium]
MARGVRPLLPLVVVWLSGSIVLWALVRQDGIPYADLVLDPAQYERRPWYTGLVSNLGVLGWTTATVASAVGAGAAQRGGRSGAAQYLRAGASLSGLLLLDDLFQLHIIVPRTLGQPKMLFYGCYAVLAAWWAFSEARELLRTRWPLLAAAVGALATSVAVDVVGGGGEQALVIEDSAKFLGILAWALYFWMTTADIVGSLAASAPHPDPSASVLRSAAVVAEGPAAVVEPRPRPEPIGPRA